jgi:hypothetical protein
MPEEVEQKTAKIHFHVDDKIGLQNYSSISYGLGISRDVPDNGDMAEIMKEVDNLVQEVEAFVAEERARILDVVQGEAHVKS